jgi:tRNA(Glu) U13 pseudouridine synthase TruD
LVFERKILRRIFGPTKERDGTWGMKTNDELNKLIGNKTVINYIESQRLGWLRHVHRMPDERMVKKVYEWKLMAIRSLG